jgi:hypothetical protein
MVHYVGLDISMVLDAPSQGSISAGQFHQHGSVSASERQVRCKSPPSLGSIPQDCFCGGLEIAPHLRHAVIAK